MDSHYSKLETLSLAIRSGNVKTVREIISKNPWIVHSARNSSQGLYSPFWEAMLSGSVEVVKLLIDFGSDVNEWYIHPSGKGLTYLHWLACCSPFLKYEIAETLIRYGADVDITGNDLLPLTPLQLAVFKYNVQFVEFLLKNGASLGNPEYLAVAFGPKLSDGCKEMLLLLLEYGLDTEFRNENGENLLNIFSQIKDDSRKLVEIGEILLDVGIPIDEVDNQGYSLLYWAIADYKFEFLSFLLDRGANVNIKCGNTEKFPLSLAVQINNVYYVDFLLSRGAEINTEDYYGCSALHEACFNHFVEIISLLIQRGADISVENKNGKTPFSLINLEHRDGEACAIAMVKELSKLSFEQIPVSNKDLNLIQAHPKIQEHFEKCTSELRRMSRTKFYPPYSYYSVLKMSKNIKKLAKLLKNEKFKAQFEENLSFHYYKDDLMRIFHEAQQVSEESVTVYIKLFSIFGELIPDVVIRKLSENLKPEDLSCADE